ncbi:MAG: FHA domain-containing protein, partial [candidate division Zixibacteria bacterium]|nr:FHA domain-containing protein [candidate division Zixibacteria bacterium]
MDEKHSQITDIKWFIEGNLTGGKKWLLPVDTYPFVIGRGADCDLQISVRHISKHHAEINEFGSSIMIHDLGSTNGTILNGTRIREPVSLKSCDHITLGGIELIIKTRADIEEDEPMHTSLFDATDHIDDFSTYYRLTKKEKEILKLLSRGRSVK